MSRIPPIEVKDAPEAAQQVLQAVGRQLGMVPNMFRVLGRAAPAAKAYAQLDALFGETSFSPVERQVVLLATSHENRCRYCMAVHSMLAERSKADPAVVAALRAGEALPDPKLAALAEFTRAVVRQRGEVSDEQLRAFEAGGYTRTQAIEVVVGVAMKTLTNYVDHIAEVPLDPAFERWAWAPSTADAA